MLNLKNTTLLLVDDELELRELMKEMLLHVTPNILLAGNGHEALQILKTQRVDAIFSDISMPKMNGLQLLAAVRQLGLQTPFVVLSGYADRENILEALRLAATDFLEKPFEPKRVEELAVRTLELGHWLQAMEAAVDEVVTNSNLPAPQRNRIKHIQGVILGLRLHRGVTEKKAV